MSHVQSFINTGIANIQRVIMESRFLTIQYNDKRFPMLQNKHPGFDGTLTMLKQKHVYG